MEWTLIIGGTIPALALLVAVWCRPEYGLLLYGVSLGFPDVVIPLAAINLRVEDLVVALYALRLLLVPAAPFSGGQRIIVTSVVVFAAICLCSAVSALVIGYDQYYVYSLFKLVGCAVGLVVVPKMVASEKRFHYLLVGLMIGGVGLVLQVAVHLINASPESILTFQDLKSSATPATWNPNTVGQAATLLTFAAAIASMSTTVSFAKRTCYALVTLFAILPAIVFSRGAVLGIAAGFVCFSVLTRRLKLLTIMTAAACIAGAVYLATLPPSIAEATHVDTETGEGLSGRYERWFFALDTISERPLLGYGFGQELAVFEERFGRALAHNSFLSSWIELGIAGPLALTAVIWSFFWTGRKLLRWPGARDQAAAVMALMVALVVEALGNGSLYWDKQPAIALTLAIGVVGLAERRYGAQREWISEAWDSTWHSPAYGQPHSIHAATSSPMSSS